MTRDDHVDPLMVAHTPRRHGTGDTRVRRWADARPGTLPLRAVLLLLVVLAVSLVNAPPTSAHRGLRRLGERTALDGSLRR